MHVSAIHVQIKCLQLRKNVAFADEKLTMLDVSVTRRFSVT